MTTEEIKAQLAKDWREWRAGDISQAEYTHRLKTLAVAYGSDYIGGLLVTTIKEG